MNATTETKTGELFVSHDGDIRCRYDGHLPGIGIARMTCYGAHDVHLRKDYYANLFCHAPEMAEALKELDSAYGIMPTSERESAQRAAWAKARAILAKIGGGE